MIVDSTARYLDPDRLYKSKKTIIRKLKNGKVKAAVGAAEELLELKPTAVTLVLGTEELQKASAASVIIGHGIEARILPNGTIGRDYSSHTSSESLKSLDFKSNL